MKNNDVVGDAMIPSLDRAQSLTRRRLLATGAAAVTVLPAEACDRYPLKPSTSPETVDGPRWVTLSSGYKVWTQRIGRGPIKVLLLHGGPGLSHDYMQCFADYLPKAGYEMYFYDQLGCGRSDRPDDASLWTLTRYRDEVEEVRNSLGLDRIVLIGHSWGGLLGIEYAMLYPDRLRGFVLSDMSASFKDFGRYATRLKRDLPKQVQARLHLLVTQGKSAGAEYNDILQTQLYARYICRLHPWPAPLRHSFEIANPAIYNDMQGSNEFSITGNLKDWDRWPALSIIRTPTLVMGARFDEMDPKSIRREAHLIPHAGLFISQSGSHLAMWDDQKNYFRAILNFLGQFHPD